MSDLDPILFKLSDPFDLKELHLLLNDEPKLLMAIGSTRLLFLSPHPLSSAFALATEDPCGVTVYDARSAQRENLPVRVKFLTSDGQETEFWARSVELVAAGA